MIMILINFSIQFGYYGLWLWFPELFNKLELYAQVVLFKQVLPIQITLILVKKKTVFVPTYSLSFLYTFENS